MFLFLSVGFLHADEDESADEIPDWLKRVSYGIDIGTETKPLIYFETVQPLYQSPEEDENIFIQSRVNIKDGNSIYNLGIGRRKIATHYNKTLLVGINAFFDYEHRRDRYRTGAGLEVIGKSLEARLNTYFGLSMTKLVDETTDSQTYEKAVDGADIEIGGPIIPHMPWIKIYGSGYWYDYKKFANKEGWRLRTRLEPFKHSHMDFIIWDDNKGDIEVRADVFVQIPFDRWEDIKDAFKKSNDAYPDRDLKDEMLKRVERSNEVTVEQWMNVGTVTIEIKRAD